MSTDNPFEFDAVEKAEGSSPEKKTSDKTKRRTKEEILADDIEGAKALLVENGYVLTYPGTEGTESADQAPFEPKNFPTNASSRNVAAELVLHNGVPVIKVAPLGWNGNAPLVLGATEIDDLLSVLGTLRTEGAKEQE